MVIKINEISEKYITQLEQRKIHKTVEFDKAAALIKNAVSETAEAAKKEIESAIEPLKAKIAIQDEYIKDKTERYKKLAKEAYKQGITPELREQKRGVADILSGLINRHQVVKKADKTAEPQKVEQPKPQDIMKPAEIAKPKMVKRVPKPETVKPKRYVVSKDIIKKIADARSNQRLDKARMEKASSLLKILLGDAPQVTTYSSVQEQFKKKKKMYIDAVNDIVNGRYNFEDEKYGNISFKVRVGRDENGKVIVKERGSDFQKDFHPYEYQIFCGDGTVIEIHDMHSDSYIRFLDTNKKELLKVCFGDHYSAFILDEEGKLMVAEGIKDGVVKYLNVNFNDVKPIPEIENDEPMNIYVQGLIKNAKRDCTSKQKDYKDTTDIDFINQDGKRTVHEYYVNKKHNSVPIFTYLFNPAEERVEKLIISADFGIHGKIVDDAYGKPKVIQYRTKGITGIDKRRKDEEKKTFHMGFYKSTENEHFETQSLYDENYELDKDSWQRPVYEKRNYGLASYPLTKAMTFYDITKHNIKPWDFGILKPYIK